MAEYHSESHHELDGDQRMISLAEDLQHIHDHLQGAIDQAETQTYEVASADGAVRVQASGRGRVVAVELDRDVMTWDPDTIDKILTATLNKALRMARVETAASLLPMLPPRLRPLVLQTMKEARESDR